MWARHACSPWPRSRRGTSVRPRGRQLPQRSPTRFGGTWPARRVWERRLEALWQHGNSTMCRQKGSNPTDSVQEDVRWSRVRAQARVTPRGWLSAIWCTSPNLSRQIVMRRGVPRFGLAPECFRSPRRRRQGGRCGACGVTVARVCFEVDSEHRFASGKRWPVLCPPAQDTTSVSVSSRGVDDASLMGCVPDCLDHLREGCFAR